MGQLIRVVHGPVGHKSLQIADPDRLTFDGAHTFCLTLGLLRADPAADSRQSIVMLKNAGGTCQVVFCQSVYEFRDGNTNRTAIHAGTGNTLETANRLLDSFFLSESGVDLFKVSAANGCIPLGHMGPFNGHSLFNGNRCCHGFSCAFIRQSAASCSR